MRKCILEGAKADYWEEDFPVIMKQYHELWNEKWHNQVEREYAQRVKLAWEKKQRDKLWKGKKKVNLESMRCAARNNS